jgi:hypothetical protein
MRDKITIEPFYKCKIHNYTSELHPCPMCSPVKTKLCGKNLKKETSPSLVLALTFGCNSEQDITLDPDFVRSLIKELIEMNNRVMWDEINN